MDSASCAMGSTSPGAASSSTQAAATRAAAAAIPSRCGRLLLLLLLLLIVGQLYCRKADLTTSHSLLLLVLVLAAVLVVPIPELLWQVSRWAAALQVLSRHKAIHHSILKCKRTSRETDVGSSHIHSRTHTFIGNCFKVIVWLGHLPNGSRRRSSKLLGTSTHYSRSKPLTEVSPRKAP